MERFTSQAIILTRTDFGEADRIITFLTPDKGKIKAIAKGVRKSRSKLAGALEIFSVSQIMILPGKGDINTLMSAKLTRHYGHIVKNLDRTEAGYEYMRLINKITQDRPEPAYFSLLDSGLAGLDKELNPGVVSLWFKVQLLKLTGHSPNFRQDSSGQKLLEAKKYTFDFDKMRFNRDPQGSLSRDDVKFLRLAIASATPPVLAKVKDAAKHTARSQQLIDAMLSAHLQI